VELASRTSDVLGGDLTNWLGQHLTSASRAPDELASRAD